RRRRPCRGTSASAAPALRRAGRDRAPRACGGSRSRRAGRRSRVRSTRTGPGSGARRRSRRPGAGAGAGSRARGGCRRTRARGRRSGVRFPWALQARPRQSYTARDRAARAAYAVRAMPDATARAHAESLADPRAFWTRAAEDIEWVRRPHEVWNDQDPLRPAWFPGALLNTCSNAVDLHVVSGRGAQTALVYDSPVTGALRRYSYAQLQDEVARLAGALLALGVERGDRVLIYMPMVPEAVFGMLACARIGAIHSVVFGGFAATELAQRIQHAAPAVVLTATCGIEPGRVVAYKPMLDEAIARASAKPRHCLVLRRPQLAAPLEPGRDVDWEHAVAGAAPAGAGAVHATDPLHILYTSGTPGVPKGGGRDNGGRARGRQGGARGSR